jgi:hypothetical protein
MSFGASAQKILPSRAPKFLFIWRDKFFHPVHLI